jgi:hypothetical protein
VSREIVVVLRRAAAIVFVGFCLACGEPRLIPQGYWSAPPDGGRLEPRDAEPARDIVTDAFDAMSQERAEAGVPDSGLRPPAAPRMCKLRCESPVECDEGDGMLYDADNFDCVDNRCEWLGCNSDHECLEVGMTTMTPMPWVCRETPDFTHRYCAPACATPEDCTLFVSAFDQDNFICENEACWYLGCNSDDECVDTFHDPRYRCAGPPGEPFRQCALTCTAPIDCVNGDAPLYSEDNYECVEGLCRWLGCVAPDECRDPARAVCE